jgi:hypothetical protein
MRGQQIHKEMIKGKSLNAESRRGRNDRLVALRNECLLNRYFYFGFYKNKTYEEIIRSLVSEFFLSPNTITLIIQKHSEELMIIKKRAAVSYYFQTKWPHLKW